MPTKWSRPGGRSCRSRTGRWRWCSHGRTCRRWIARSTLQPRGWPAAAMCWPMPAAGPRKESWWRPAGKAEGLARGGYVLADASGGTPQVILMATGSEVGATVEAYEQLVAQGVKARIVSIPCMELFAEQDQAYRDSVLPPQVTARVAVEAGV